MLMKLLGEVGCRLWWHVRMTNTKRLVIFVVLGGIENSHEVEFDFLEIQVALRTFTRSFVGLFMIMGD